MQYLSRYILTFLSLTCLLSATQGDFPLYLNGYFGPKAGYMPPPGLYVRNDCYHHNGHANSSVLGGFVSGKVKAKISLDILDLTYVTPLKLLGANVAFGALAPAGRIAINAQLDAVVPSLSVNTGPLGLPSPTITLNNTTVKKYQVAHGLADCLILPLMLGWHAPDYDLHILAFQGLFVPTGKYSKNKIANMGQNHYATETDVGFTWLNEAIGTEVSAMTGITSNFTNHKTHYRSGTGWHTDFFAGQYVSKKMQIGLSGYWFYQLTPDSGRGSKILGGNRGYVLGLGPSISYEFDICKLPIIVNARYFKETHSKNYLKGETFYLTITVPIP